MTSSVRRAASEPSALDRRLAAGIGEGCRLVQHDDGRGLQHGAHNGDALPLATGKRGAAGCELLIVAIRQGRDESGRLCRARGGPDFFKGRCGFSEGDIGGDRVGKEKDGLEDDADLLHDLFDRDLSQIDAAERDATRGDIIEARDQRCAVLLPEPDAPTSAVTVPSRTVKETSCNTVRSP
jgi:hypothetical protein